VDSFLCKVCDSLPSKPSVDATNGEKCRCCSRQALRCFFFFSLSWASNNDFASTSVIRTLIMQSVLRAQSPHTKISPRSSVRLFGKRRVLTAGLSCFLGLDFGRLRSATGIDSWFVANWGGKKALEARSLNSS
jgi:hypothetical protein